MVTAIAPDILSTHQDVILGAVAAILRRDPIKLVEGFEDISLKIKTKDGQLVYLRPNRPQQRFLQLFQQLRDTQEPIRIVILKARQWGGTTITDAIMYALTSQQSNINAMIIADDTKGAGYILEMAKIFHEELAKTFPPPVVPEITRSNRLELAFKGTKSTIFIDSAENKDAGQKYTLQYLHCSEVSKYHHTDEMFKGLLPAVSKAPGTFIVLESTANGVGDYFHRIVKDAEHNIDRLEQDLSQYDGEWILFFVPWMEHEEYSKPFPGDEAKQEFMAALSDREKSLFKMRYQTVDGIKEVTPEQLNWRRWILEQEFHGDEDAFNEMYPATIDEAFLVSGRPRFNTQRLKEIYDYAQGQQYHQGTLDFPSEQERTRPGVTKDSVLFHPDPHGEWHIWEMPDWRCEYVIAVDTAGGEEIEGTSEGKKGDYNCIEVFKRPRIEQNGDGVLTQVAEYRSRIDPDLLADEAYMAYLAYNQPVIFLEVNNHGRTTADHLKHRCSLYRREIYDEITRKVTQKLGWYTDKNTKKQMIDTLAEAIRDNWIVIRSTILAGELRTYVRTSDGTTNAQEGCFDDTVMGAALAVQAQLRVPRADAFKTREIKNMAVGR